MVTWKRAKGMTTNRCAAISLPRVVTVLIVIALAIVILRLVILTPSADPKKSMILRAERTLCDIRTAIELYRADCGSPPSEANGLQALLSHTDASGWMGPYLTELVPDPWNTPFRYELTNGQVIVTSAGPDKIFGTKDDIRVIAVGAPRISP